MPLWFRFLHAADLHLASPVQALAEESEAIQARLAGAVLSTWERIVQAAIDARVEFVLIAGDIYDSATPSLRAQVRFRDGVQTLDRHGIAVYVVRGNHDHLGAQTARLQWPGNLHVFGGEQPECVVHRGPGGLPLAEIWGISFQQRQESRNLAAALGRASAGGPGREKLRLPSQPAAAPPCRIALLHANVGGHSAHADDAPCQLSDLLDQPFDYWALGHIHAPQILHPQTPLVVYPGIPQGRDAGEAGPRGVYLVSVYGEDSGRLRLEARFLPVAAVRWEVRTVDAGGIDSEEALLQRLDEAKEAARQGPAAPEAPRSLASAPPPGLPGESGGTPDPSPAPTLALAPPPDPAASPAVVRLVVQGATPLYGLLQSPEALAALAEQLRAGEDSRPDFAWVESIQSQARPALDLPRIQASATFAGEFVRQIGLALEAVPDGASAVLGAASPAPPGAAPIPALDLDRRLRRWLKPEDLPLRALLEEARDLALDLLEGRR